MAKWVRVAPVFNYAPSRRTYHVMCELTQNSVGALSDVLARLAKANLNLLSISSASQPTSAVAVISLIAEPVGEELTDEDVKALVEKSPRVLSALVESSDGGILLEKQLFPTVLLTGQRVMMTRVDAIASMLKSIREKFGSGGEVVVYQEGYEAGLSEASGLVKMMGRDELVWHAEQIATFRTALG